MKHELGRLTGAVASTLSVGAGSLSTGAATTRAWGTRPAASTNMAAWIFLIL